MQGAFLDGLVEGRYGLAVGLFGGGLVALGDGLAQIAQLAAQGRGVGAVTRRTAFSLTGAL